MKNTLLIVFGVIVISCAVFFGLHSQYSQSLGAIQAINNYDTTNAGFTHATSTVNTTSTQVFSSIGRVSYITNNTTSTLTCALDAIGTIAASSTVASGRGVLIGPNTGTLIPSVVAFGECRTVGIPCYPHKGAVDCLANVAVTITTSVQ